MARATIVLPATPPFRLDLTAWALRRRKKNVVDRWDGHRYSRIIVADDVPARLTVTQETFGVEPTLLVTLESAARMSRQAKEDAGRLVHKVLGLAVDLRPFYDRARGNAAIEGLVERFLGVRPPRFPSVFEALVNAIACQQVTLDLGIVLLNRFRSDSGRTSSPRAPCGTRSPRRPTWPTCPRSPSRDWGSVA
ncbi:MAG: hypothetical protein GEV28_00420 [Actinophytocola sp.]|uniref:hypothetical protein n=1 Tax=Actinophytocola sp. TaxID=1872138 RepID=UPI001326006A|nr:hypothetical protein [Actinophytocola sp.]MPZ78934.1 hypothetical protein [Actinophytocola sp.]